MSVFIKGPLAAVLTDENGYKIDSTNPIPVTLGSAVISVNPAESGGANFVAGQQALAVTAVQIAAVRATRRGILISNDDTAINVFVGAAGVTTSNGKKIPPGQAVTLPIIGAIYGVSVSATPTVSFFDIYD